ncbi:PREDICTED: DBH-like monooxygenase protein 1 [Haliaeetus leucocephalus]|uniref:DBH-like monooxygenase protein 1 n=2 Tax=Accipitrinae TaxID=8955 RepID=UPI00053CAED1|nr:PREDICTED: DBH-like monooxygenase protein 1 [Haliaeetus leucocephalus]
MDIVKGRLDRHLLGLTQMGDQEQEGLWVELDIVSKMLSQQDGLLENITTSTNSQGAGEHSSNPLFRSLLSYRRGGGVGVQAPAGPAVPGDQRGGPVRRLLSAAARQEEDFSLVNASPERLSGQPPREAGSRGERTAAFGLFPSSGVPLPRPRPRPRRSSSFSVRSVPAFPLNSYCQGYGWEQECGAEAPLVLPVKHPLQEAPVAGGQDYFTDENRVLKKDPQQDYHLEYAMENSTHTILAFSRELHTCDANDKSITESTVRVIWAYHHKDMGEAGQNYHGSNRGTKSLRLLNPEKEEVLSASLPYFDLTNKDVPVPDKDTTYWCQMFKIPVQHEKHHVTKVEPLIQKGHENLVHHILLYQCSSNLNDSVLDYGHECYHPNMPDSFLTCETVIFAWAIGGEGFTYPPHVGLSIGTAADPQFVLMEVHYDNPSYTEGLIDNSGLRLIYTPVLRKYDAGVIEAGLWVSLFHNIPPGMPEFVSEGHCTLECLEEALGAERPAGIHVFAVLLHAHLAGRAIRMRHFHNGEEQKLLAYDDEFDFNFQEFQYLKEERTILPGDNLITECHYSTVDRIRMTWGGLSTRNEMCLSYLLYYPRINLTRCASIPDIMEQLQFIGVKEIYRPVRTWPFIIKSPKQYKNLSFMDAMNKFKWSRSEGLSYNELVLKLPVNVRCSKTDNAEWSIQGMTALPPEIERPYKTEPVICSSSSCLHCSLFLTLLFVVCVTASTIGNIGPFV